MRNLITLICLLSCFFSASLSAQCETDIVITNIECEDNFWIFDFEVQVDNAPINAGIIYPNDPTVYPFNFPVTVSLPFNLGQTEIILTYVGLTGCEGESFFVTEPECPTDPCPLEIEGTVANEPNCGESNGTAFFQVAGTTGDYQISYSGDNGHSGSVVNENFINGLQAGCYTFELSDDTDMCSALTNLCFEAQADMIITFITILDDCEEVSYRVEVNGGTPPYFFEWSDGLSGDLTGPLVSGLYSLTVIDINGCSVSFDLEVDLFTILDVESNPGTVQNATCGQNDGSISPVVSQGIAPYTYEWSNGATSASITGLSLGSYSVTITDDVGCMATEIYLVEEIASFEVDINADNPFPAICSPGETQLLTAFVNGTDNTPGFVFTWTDPIGNIVSATQSISVTEPGLYTVTVSDASNNTCQQVDRITVLGGESDEDALEIVFYSVDSLDGYCDLFLQARYDGFNVSTDWTVPTGETLTANTVSAQNYGPGIYSVTIYPPAGTCPFTDTVLVNPEDITCVNLSGTVFLDENEDCVTTGSELTIASQLVQLTNVANPDRVYYAYTSLSGSWNVTIPEGTYLVTALESNELFESCPAQTITVQVGTVADPVNLGLVPLASCPRVTVDLNIPRIRRCFDSPVYIYYENTGTAVSENTVISVEFGEWIDEVNPGFGTQPSSIVTDPTTGVTTASWNIGSLDPFSGGTLNVLAYTCNNDAPVFSAACVVATVSPSSPCPPVDEAWTGASVVVEGECEGDNVVFTMRNIGNGDMSVGLQYIIVEDGVIIRPNEEDDPLVSGSEFEVSLPANGNTYHLRALQEPFHPGLLMPIDFVEGCGTGNTSTGFALQFPVSDDAYWIDEDCQEIIGAYDPNDKMAEPKGYSEANYIVADQPIDYQIRFQNTGNDTAFSVIIRDTVSELLDMSTFQLLSSTHDVSISIDSSKGLAFIFEDIMLPDSFVNEPASNGAISYRILPVADLEPGTEIENTAHIYFDFNSAIVTNTYRHTIEEDFVAVSVFDFNPVINRLTVYPNPTAGPARIQLPEAMEGEVLELDVVDALGRVMQHYNYTNGERPDANLSRLAAGWYTLRLTNGKTTVGTGRVLLEK